MSQASKQTYNQQVRSGKIDSNKETIRKYLKQKDGMTSIDLCQTLGMQWSTFAARISELRTKGEVCYTGEEKTLFSTCSILRYEHDIERQKERAKQLEKERWNKRIKSVMKDSLCNSRLKDMLESEIV